jgi:hypothetical protein
MGSKAGFSGKGQEMGMVVGRWGVAARILLTEMRINDERGESAAKSTREN